MRFWRRGEAEATQPLAPEDESATPAPDRPTPSPDRPTPAPDRPTASPDRSTGAGAGSPATTVDERIAGLRAWLAQLDRKLGIRTYALGAAVVLALAAGIVGVVLALSAKDESATKNEVRALRDQVEATRQEATQAAEESVQSLSGQVDSLQQRISGFAASQGGIQQELSVVQDDIDDLRNQISQLEASSDAGTTDTGAETPGTPGTDTTTNERQTP